MASAFIICSLMSSTMADYATDLKINRTYVAFMHQFEGFVQKTSHAAIVQAYQAQIQTSNAKNSAVRYSLTEIQQLSNNITAPVIAKFRPIAYKLIYDAGYNTYGEYYIWNRTTNVWHLPNQRVPSKPVNGTAVNSQLLSKKLQTAFMHIISRKQLPGLQKRFFGLERLFASAKTTTLIKNIKASPPEEILKGISDFKKVHSDLSSGDGRSLAALEESAKKQIEWRKSASDELQQRLKLSDQTPDLDTRISALKQQMESSKDQDLKVLKKELKMAEDIMFSDKPIFDRFFRSTYAKVIGGFLM